MEKKYLILEVIGNICFDPNYATISTFDRFRFIVKLVVIERGHHMVAFLNDSQRR